MSSSQDTSLKSIAWFPSTPARKAEGGVGPALVKLAAGMAFGLLLLASHRLALAITVLVTVGVLFLLSVLSPSAQKFIDGALLRFGRAVGGVVGALVLSFVYVFLFV